MDTSSSQGGQAPSQQHLLLPEPFEGNSPWGTVLLDSSNPPSPLAIPAINVENLDRLSEENSLGKTGFEGWRLATTITETDQEDRDMAAAIEASLQEYELRGPTHGSTTNSQEREQDEENPTTSTQADETATTPPPSRRRNIGDCIDDLLERPVSDVTRLDCQDGDTWIFIKPPARQPEHTAEVYEQICDRYNTPFRASSQALRSSESKLILEQLNSSTQQYRIMRRFTVKQEMDAAGIKYVLDLTPPVEGDRAVELTSDFSCPSSVLNWASESDLYRVSDTMVGGADEFEPGRPRARQRTSSVKPIAPADYTPLRHRASLERVLLTLHGKDIKLNSAPKVYTTVMAAVKHLLIPAHGLSVLTDYVVTWLRALPNCIFIELHPEVTLTLADCLQVAHLCQDAFSILVGEAALAMSAQYNDSIYRRDDCTVHGRRTDYIDESWETRIQYARNTFVERIETCVFKAFMGGQMAWVEELASVARVSARIPPIYKDAHAAWLSSLKDYARGAFYHLLAATYSIIRTSYRSDRPDMEHDTSPTLFNSLRYKERIFTRSFWRILTQCFFPEGGTGNVAIEPLSLSGNTIDRCQQSPEYKSLGSAGMLKFVSDLFVQCGPYEMAASPASRTPSSWSNTNTSGSAETGGFENTYEPIVFRIDDFQDQIRQVFVAFANNMLVQQNPGSLERSESDVLLCMCENEMKFLPLWAGGMDDGSSGVFDSEVPAISEEEGFGPAREGLRRRIDEGDRDYDDLSTTLGVPTEATSKMANDGRSVLLNRRTVYAADEVESVRHTDSVSNAGTDTTWERLTSDNASVSTSSELVGEMLRTRFGLDGFNATLVSTGAENRGEDLAGLEESDTDVATDFMDSESRMETDDSDVEFIRKQKDPAKDKGKRRERTNVTIKEWARQNPEEASSVIKYRERSLSPLVFEKS